jgi:DNA-binding winged helix-turn-helix (wHTH) protein/Flp pilus assembly protein TadD
VQFRFGPFRADRDAYRVWKGDEALDLTPKLLDLLFFFLERPQTLVTKEQLLDGVWPGANVTENALAQAISELRDALGDVPASPTYIKTIARRGYRFVAAVDAGTSSASVPPPGPAARATTAAADAAGVTRATAGTVAAAPGARRTIVVVAFANLSADADLAWLGEGIAETVSNDLAELGAFHVVDRWRVFEASRAAGRDNLRAIAAALGASLAVTGSYQRQGPTLRVTGRIVDLDADTVLADAKVDGPLSDAFALQDAIVAAFARDLGVRRQGVDHPSSRETSNLDAYRAYVEGWLKIESLDTELTSAAVADFERAIALDPRYATAYTGLATAELQAYETSRVEEQPDVRALTSSLEHARQAVRLDDRLAEAHAALSFVLVTAGQAAEARAAAQRAVALDPDNWRHQYRLGHALWGEARLRALERVLALYPDFAWARFEMAMVHVARGRLLDAEAAVREGVLLQDRQARTADRFPAIGFHWLMGTLLAASGRHEAAVEEFTRELSQAGRRRLYGPEYAAASEVGIGMASLAQERPADAISAFQSALEMVRGFPRALLALAAALRQIGRPDEARRVRERAQRVCVGLRTHRPPEALLVAAADAALHDASERALVPLGQLLDIEPATFLGWAIGVDPLLTRLRGRPEFAALLARVAARAG